MCSNNVDSGQRTYSSEELALQEIVLEGHESSNCCLVATWIDADGRDSNDCRFVSTWIDAVKRSPTSADTAVCVRGEVSCPSELWLRWPTVYSCIYTFPQKLESWRLNAQSLRNPVLVSSSIRPRIQTSSAVSLVDSGFWDCPLSD